MSEGLDLLKGIASLKDIAGGSSGHIGSINYTYVVRVRVTMVRPRLTIIEGFRSTDNVRLVIAGDLKPHVAT